MSAVEFGGQRRAGCPRVGQRACATRARFMHLAISLFDQLAPLHDAAARSSRRCLRSLLFCLAIASARCCCSICARRSRSCCSASSRCLRCRCSASPRSEASGSSVARPRFLPGHGFHDSPIIHDDGLHVRPQRSFDGAFPFGVHRNQRRDRAAHAGQLGRQHRARARIKADHVGADLAQRLVPRAQFGLGGAG